MASMIKCPTCGLALSDAHASCPYDGTPLTAELDRTLEESDPEPAAPWNPNEVTAKPAPRASGPKPMPPGSFEPTVRREPAPRASGPKPMPAAVAGFEPTVRRSREHLARPAPAPAAAPGAAAPPAVHPFNGDEQTLRNERELGTAKTSLRPDGLGVTVTASAEGVEADPLVGARLGEYVVKERIGMGGMGLVYRGEQPIIGKPVAIKVLRPDVVDKPIHMERLLAEARAVNAIRHRGIIDIFSFGQTPDGRQYFVMEFLDGMPLENYIAERGLLTPQEAIGISEEILAALNAAHEAGVIHRDLKSNNIFRVKQPGGGFYVKVLDFGLAKLGGTAALPNSPQTAAGLIMGTPEYMAPEQIRGAPVTSKTDLYAFGIIVFQMLTGHMPFTAATPAEYLVLQLQQLPPAPIDLQPDVPQELSDLVVELMAKDPAARPAMADVRTRLKRISRALPQLGTNMQVVQAYVAPAPRPAPAPAPARPNQLRPSIPPGRVARTHETMTAPAASVDPKPGVASKVSAGHVAEIPPEPSTDAALQPGPPAHPEDAQDALTLDGESAPSRAPTEPAVARARTTDLALQPPGAGRGKLIAAVVIAVALIGAIAFFALRSKPSGGPDAPAKPATVGSSDAVKPPPEPPLRTADTPAPPTPEHREDTPEPAQPNPAKPPPAADPASTIASTKANPPAPAKVDRKNPNSKQALRDRIDSLKHQLRLTSLSSDERNAALSLLRKASNRLEGGDTDYKAINESLRTWEHQYLNR